MMWSTGKKRCDLAYGIGKPLVTAIAGHFLRDCSSAAIDRASVVCGSHRQSAAARRSLRLLTLAPEPTRCSHGHHDRRPPARCTL